LTRIGLELVVFFWNEKQTLVMNLNEFGKYLTEVCVWSLSNFSIDPRNGLVPNFADLVPRHYFNQLWQNEKSLAIQ